MKNKDIPQKNLLRFYSFSDSACFPFRNTSLKQWWSTILPISTKTRTGDWAWVEQHPTSLYLTIDWFYASVMRGCRCCKRWSHTQTSILHDNFCLSMICSDNDIEKFCWYCLICYAHMNLNYTIFVDFFFFM